MPTKQQMTILQNRIEQLELENKHLHETVSFLTKKLYGKSSETSKALGIEGQMSLFDEAETEAEPLAVEPAWEEVEKVLRKKYKGQRKDKLDKLPHDKILFKLEPEQLSCPDCGTRMKPVGEEFVRTEVDYIPAVIKVLDYFRETYECRHCKQSGHICMTKTPMPEPVVPHSFASPSSVAHVMYQKYVNAVPLYRQEKDWVNLGLDLTRQTMSNWILIAAREWLIPMVELFHQKLLSEICIHADETKVQVMNEKDRKNTTDSFMWVYGSYQNSTFPVRIFEYHPTRNGDHAKKFLKGFHGYLITDAYQGYEKVEGVTRCYCWSHLRRYFVEALPPNIEDAEATLPIQAIEYCKKLFQIEAEIEDLSPEKKKRKRQEQSKPVLEVFWSWVDKNKEQCLPKSKLAKAFGYAINQKEGLMNYLTDGNIAMSNNLAENSIRPFTIGRKNWLFSGSPEGAEASAAVYSIIETTKANGINPYEYLRYLFKYLPGVRFREHPELLEHFLPWNTEVQVFCKKTGK